MNVPSIFYFVAPVIGFFTLLIGVAAVIKPQPMSTKFGISVSGSALPYVVSTGIRDVFMGLAIFILFYFQHWTALGVTIGCIGIVAISDFLVVLKHGDKKTSLVHLLGTVLVVAYGSWLYSQS